MDCPKCGAEMKKGCLTYPALDVIGLKNYGFEWFYDKTVEENSGFFKALTVRADIEFSVKKYKTGRYGLDAYLCEKCGTMTVFPLPEDAENIEYYIETDEEEFE